MSSTILSGLLFKFENKFKWDFFDVSLKSVINYKLSEVLVKWKIEINKRISYAHTIRIISLKLNEVQQFKFFIHFQNDIRNVCH